MTRRVPSLTACGVLAVLSLAAPAADPAKPDVVFLLIGQSNMSGRAPLAKGDDEPIPGVLLLTDKGAWEPAAVPFNKYSNLPDNFPPGKVNPALGFVTAMREADPKTTLGVVCNSRGGSNINEWAKGKPLYDKTLKRLTDAKVTPDAVLWHQGESNAQDPDYLAKLEQLVATLRADFQKPDLPFVAGQVAPENKSYAAVNALIAKLPETVKGTAVATSEGLTTFDKGVHFDRASQLTLGKRYAEAYRKLVSK